MAGTALYDEDFVRWSAAQASALRAAAEAGTNLPLDWENIAEEIESLGKSNRRELASRTSTILEHLLKLECSSSAGPRAGWVDTVLRSRREVELLIEDSPSLRRELTAVIARAEAGATRLAASALDAADEPDAAAIARAGTAGRTLDQVFGDWLPERSSPTSGESDHR